MKNNATRTIRSEEITIDVRICAALAANRGSEVYLAAIAPDMELTVITLDEAPGILPCFEEDDACLNLPNTSLLLCYNPEQILDEEQKQCFCVLSDYYHLLRKWKTEYAPKSMDEEWHPCFVEALQNISKVEYQLDTLLEKDIPDRASVVSDIGKGVKSIAGRIEEYRRSQGDAGEHRKGRSQENSR